MKVPGEFVRAREALCASGESAGVGLFARVRPDVTGPGARGGGRPCRRAGTCRDVEGPVLVLLVAVERSAGEEP